MTTIFFVRSTVQDLTDYENDDSYKTGAGFTKKEDATAYAEELMARLNADKTCSGEVVMTEAVLYDSPVTVRGKTLRDLMD